MIRESALGVLAGVVLAACGGKPPAESPTTTTVTVPGGGQASGAQVVAGGYQASTPVPDAESVVNAMRADLRLCYEEALRRDRTLEGAVRIEVKIDPKGGVASAQPAAPTTLPVDVVTCIVARIQRAQFAAPGASGSTLIVPLAFKKES